MALLGAITCRMAAMDPIDQYFQAERIESRLFIFVGIASLCVALWGWFVVRQPFARGLGWSLAAVAAIQLIVGATVFVRSPRDIERVHQIIAADAQRIGSEEVPRMRAVMDNFKTYRIIEMTLLVTGAGLAFRMAPGSAWRGAGLGLATQSLTMLALDFFAERRGEQYLTFLLSIPGS